MCEKVTKHNSAVWPSPQACAQPYHPRSGSHGQLFRPVIWLYACVRWWPHLRVVFCDFLSHFVYTYVVVQFCFWFNLDFLLFDIHYHIIYTKLLQRTYFALLLSRRQSKLPSNISQLVSWSKLSNLSALDWTLPIPKIRQRLMALKMYQPPRIYRQTNSSKHIKIDWFSDFKCSQYYSKFLTNLTHLRE